MTKMPLADHNNVVKAFPSDRTDQPFSNRVPLVHQHTNSITSDEHEAAIHSEDLTRDPARARARKGE
jgi:hypothetical protein